MAKAVQNINPSVLKWARERKHYSCADIVGKFNRKSVTDGILADWEEGRKSPTYPQLEKLANYYKVPIAVFFFPEPPDIEDVEASLRSVSRFDLSLIPPDTLDVIHRVQAAQMALKEFNDGVNPVPSPIHKMIKLDSSKSAPDIETLAESLREEKFLNVPLKRQLDCTSYMQALEVWRDAVEEKGIFVFRWPFKSENLSGFCLYDEEFPVICLDSQESKGRQIFTLLHELAHLLHGESSITLVKDGIEIREDDTLESEHHFDGIAGSVLVPIDDLKERISRAFSHEDKDFYTETANTYKVSAQMLLVRCRLAGLISYEVFTGIRESLMTGSGNYQSGRGGDYYLNQLSYWGKAFLQNILAKRHLNRISEYEMSQVLNMKIKNIEKLESYLIRKQMQL